MTEQIKYIESAFDSLLNKSHGNFQIIFVVDDLKRPGRYLDYGRETAPSHIDSLEKAIMWAKMWFDLNADSHSKEHVVGFKVDRF